VLAQPAQPALSARGGAAVHRLNADGGVRVGAGPEVLVHVADRQSEAARHLRYLGYRDAAGRTRSVNNSPTSLLPSGSAAAPGDGWCYCDYSAANLVLAANHNYRVAAGMFEPGFVWYSGDQGYWLTNGGGQ
jgi:hypothetical protein